MWDSGLKIPPTSLTPRGFQVEGAGPDLLAELLDAYWFEIHRLAPDIADAMQPGLSESHIFDLFEVLGVQPPAEAVVWWRWRNGFPLYFGHGMGTPQLTLYMVVKLHRLESLGTDPGQWDPKWVRVAGEGGKFSLAMDCAEPASPPSVRSFRRDLTEWAMNRRPSAVSLCTPISWWLLGMASGWTTYSESRGWFTDLERFPYEWRLGELV